MSVEKKDKESKKVAERVIPMQRDHLFKNEVIADNIRKETNYLEKVSRRLWSQKYEHLTGHFFNEVLTEECRKAGLPVNTFKRDPPKDDAIERSPIPLKASPAFPKTTSGEIGHRSSRAEYNLEFTGPLYVSPKCTIEPPVMDNELRVTQQRFIFLG